MNPDNSQDNQDQVPTTPTTPIANETVDTSIQTPITSRNENSNDAPQPTPNMPTGSQNPSQTLPKEKTSRPRSSKVLALVALLVVIFLASNSAFYLLGKHGQKVIIKAPTPPPITLPRQTIEVSNCVAGLGKEFVIPKDIPTGPIYYTQNRKVIAVEYDYKAVDIYLNPQLLSDAIVPLTKNYQIASFTTKIDSLNASTAEAAQNDKIQLIMYVVPRSVAQKITCST